jgi:2-C-methyl-D-erythritol 2,4-cyclodiphosphate synthase
MTLRIGQGYDVHRLVDGRPLVLGGETIPADRGLAGFSDANVVLHALADALLGALALGDLGQHFPPGDPRWEGVDSVDLLHRVVGLIRQKGARVVNCDVTVMAERPKLALHAAAMRRRIAGVLEVEPDRVSVKATTGEGLGPVGRGEGIAALAVALVEAD